MDGLHKFEFQLNEVKDMEKDFIQKCRKAGTSPVKCNIMSHTMYDGSKNKIRDEQAKYIRMKSQQSKAELKRLQDMRAKRDVISASHPAPPREVKNIVEDRTPTEIIKEVRKTIEDEHRHDEKMSAGTQKRLDATLQHVLDMESKMQETNRIMQTQRIKDEKMHKHDVEKMYQQKLHDEKIHERDMVHEEYLKMVIKHEHSVFDQMRNRIDTLVHDQSHPNYHYGHHTTLCGDIEQLLTVHKTECDAIRLMYNNAHCCGLQPPPTPPELVGIEVSVIVMTTLVALAMIFFTIYYSIRYCACCACCRCCACCFCDRRRRKRRLPKGYSKENVDYYYHKL